MPAETKSFPSNPEDAERLGIVHEKLEGYVPALASDEDLRIALEKAFDYRGDVTITLKSGEVVDGYIFDRRTGKTLADSIIRLFPSKGGLAGTSGEKRSIAYADIAAMSFSGRDTAAGKSWETWVKKYQERKAAGETDIGIEPEKLD